MALDPLATLADLEARATISNEPRASALLLGASARVRKFTRQNFTAATNIEVVKRVQEIAAPSPIGFVRLPQRPVTAVHSVVDVQTGAAVTYEWLGDDEVTFSLDLRTLTSTQMFYFPTTGAVRVTYDYGFDADELPPDVVEIVCNMVLRAYGLDPTQTGTQQESIEGYSHTLGSAAAAGAIGLLPEEKDALKVYRRPGRSLRLA